MTVQSKLIAPIVHCHCRRVLLIARQGLWTGARFSPKMDDYWSFDGAAHELDLRPQLITRLPTLLRFKDAAGRIRSWETKSAGECIIRMQTEMPVMEP